MTGWSSWSGTAPTTPRPSTPGVGVAIGLTGADIAMETAGVTLSTNRLDRVPKLLRIGRDTMRIIRLNIAFDMLVNVAGIMLSASGVVPPGCLHNP